MHMTREIHKLRNRLKNLQEQLEKATEESKTRIADATSPSVKSPSVSNTTSSNTTPAELPNSHRQTWDGVYDPELQTGRVIHYGPLSSSYMVMRLNRYMSQSSNQLHLKSLLPVRISQIHRHSPTVSHEQLLDEGEQSSLRPGLAEVEDLSREQEEHFLVLLWQAYNCIYPVVVEEEFREYYNSLWEGTNGQAPRQPSALVDSLLAVCMQYGSTFMVEDEDDMAGGETESHVTRFHTAAHAFYRRSQRVLMEKLENPSIKSLQSHIYCIIYLYNTANLDTAHALLGLAIRIAHMLRLHIRPLGPTPGPKQELFSRIWWTLYQLDSQISMTLGRPPLIDPDEVGCAMPRDSGDAFQLSTLISPPSEQEISWLSFHVQYVRLMAAARWVYDAFGARCAQVLRTKGIQDIHDDRPTLESLAGVLSSQVHVMYDWVQTVPQSLKNQRKGSGEAFSTDRTPVNLNPASPLWLQRQRLLLEIVYHHLQIANFRPFVRFPPRGAFLTSLSDNHGITSLNHAVVLTIILNQAISETDLLSGWTSLFQYQWDATVCILSFVLANPVCPPTPAARKILPKALQNLHKLGQSFSPAANTIQLAWEQFRSSANPYGWSQLTPPSQSSSDTTELPPTSVLSSSLNNAPMMNKSALPPNDLFPGLLTGPKTPSSTILGNAFSNSAAITPPLDFVDPSFDLPNYLLMGADTQWMDGSMPMDGWTGYGSQ
jgi:Fungal specific transcription factor domain